MIDFHILRNYLHVKTLTEIQVYLDKPLVLN